MDDAVRLALQEFLDDFERDYDNFPQNGDWVAHFDLTIKYITQPPPDGWGMSTSTVYGRVSAAMRQQGFTQHEQYSGYVMPDATVQMATMASVMVLTTVNPLGLLPTVLNRYLLAFVPNNFIMTDAMQLTGAFFPTTVDAVPANLIPGPHENLNLEDLGGGMARMPVEAD